MFTCKISIQQQEELHNLLRMLEAKKFHVNIEFFIFSCGFVLEELTAELPFGD